MIRILAVASREYFWNHSCMRKIYIIFACFIFRTVSIQAEDPKVSELREQLDRLAAERESREANPVEWVLEESPPVEDTKKDFSRVTIQMEALGLGAAWVFRSLDDGTTKTIRASLYGTGQEQFEIPSGRWEITLRVGYPASVSKKFGPREVDALPGKSYRSIVSRANEEAVRSAKRQRVSDGKLKDDLSPRPIRFKSGNRASGKR